MAITQAIKARPRRSPISNFEISPNLDAIARVGRPGRPARPRQQHQRVPRHRPHPGYPRTTGDYARLLDITKWEGAQGFRSYAETEYWLPTSAGPRCGVVAVPFVLLGVRSGPAPYPTVSSRDPAVITVQYTDHKSLRTRMSAGRGISFSAPQEILKIC